MKMKVYEPEEENSNLYLTLVETHDGVDLCVVNKIGKELNQGSICRIDKTGTLYLYRDLNVPGLQTDDKGKILIKEDY